MSGERGIHHFRPQVRKVKGAQTNALRRVTSRPDALNFLIDA